MKNPIQRHLQADAVKKVAHQLLGMDHFSVIALFMVALFFLGAGWLPDAGTNLLLPGGIKKTGWFQLAGSVIVFTFFGLLIRYNLKKQQQVKIVTSSPPLARILIIFLSTCSKTLWERLQAKEEVTVEQLVGTSWEMPLLAIEYHQKRLEQLFVFTSAGANGTHHQFKAFHDIIAARYPKLKIIEMTGEGTDFEDMATVHRELDQLYEQFDRLPEYGSQDIILDITGGQKPNSIAGALATLAEGRQFQYVSTVNKKVLCYDLVVDTIKAP